MNQIDCQIIESKMGNQNIKSQHEGNTTTTCTNCNKNVNIQSNFCNHCGTKLKDLICDEQYQKQISKKQEQRQEDKGKKIKISKQQEQQQCQQKHEEQNKMPKQLIEVQEKITSLQQQISQHREEIKKQNPCWKFGFDFSGDYGDVWSSTSYWHLLITSNQRICTDNMHFMTYEQPCQKCINNIQILQKCKKQWEDKIVDQHIFLKKE